MKSKRQKELIKTGKKTTGNKWGDFPHPWQGYLYKSLQIVNTLPITKMNCTKSREYQKFQGEGK